MRVGEAVAEFAGDLPQLASADDAVLVQIEHLEVVPVDADLVRGELRELPRHVRASEMGQKSNGDLNGKNDQFGIDFLVLLGLASLVSCLQPRAY